MRRSAAATDAAIRAIRPALVVAWLAGTLVAAGPALAAGPANVGTPSAHRTRFTVVMPAAAGMDAATLDAAVELFRGAVAREDLPGVVLLVARGDRVVLHEALGWRDRERRLPMERDTLFRMASNTKPAVALAALLLEQDGRLAMNDPVSKYIPAFADGPLARITIHQLATHSSGLPRSPIFLPGLTAESDLIREAARFAGALKLNREPGTAYEYSNAGYNILGGVIEAASGRKLQDLLRERVYEPLGMSETNHHESTADHARMSKVYRRADGVWRPVWSPGDPPSYPIVRASGGMISTAIDYATFLHFWLRRGEHAGRQILAPENVARATSPLVRDGDAGYGYGWRVTSDGVFGHGGSDGTQAWVDPARELLVLVFTQVTAGGVNPRNEFLRRVQSAVRSS